MKKILFAIAVVLTMGLSANAQSKNDAFFNDWSDGNNDFWRTTVLINLPSGGLGEISGNPDAPLGSGLLFLSVLGVGYAVSRKRKH
jgi:hypothetical protein